MHPILFQIGDFPIGTYGLMLTLGFLAGMYLARHLGRRDGLEPDALTDISIAVLLGGILGSKLLMIVVDMIHGEPLASVFSLSTLRAGGAIHGGVILGLLTFFWRMRKLKLPLRPTMDALTPGLALGQAIGLGLLLRGLLLRHRMPRPLGRDLHQPRATPGTPLDCPSIPCSSTTASPISPSWACSCSSAASAGSRARWPPAISCWRAWAARSRKSGAATWTGASGSASPGFPRAACG